MACSNEARPAALLQIGPQVRLTGAEVRMLAALVDGDTCQIRVGFGDERAPHGRGLYAWRSGAVGEVTPLFESADGLWAVHIQGPDDLHAAPSRAAAESYAQAFNDWFKHRRDAHVYDPRCFATAVAWPYGPKQHAEQVQHWQELQPRAAEAPAAQEVA